MKKILLTCAIMLIQGISCAMPDEKLAKPVLADEVFNIAKESYDIKTKEDAERDLESEIPFYFKDLFHKNVKIGGKEYKLLAVDRNKLFDLYAEQGEGLKGFLNSMNLSIGYKENNALFYNDGSHYDAKFFRKGDGGDKKWSMTFSLHEKGVDEKDG